MKLAKGEFYRICRTEPRSRSGAHLCRHRPNGAISEVWRVWQTARSGKYAEHRGNRRRSRIVYGRTKAQETSRDPRSRLTSTYAGPQGRFVRRGAGCPGCVSSLRQKRNRQSPQFRRPRSQGTGATEYNPVSYPSNIARDSSGPEPPIPRRAPFAPAREHGAARRNAPKSIQWPTKC